jgi:meiotic recombination protein SPO11
LPDFVRIVDKETERVFSNPSTVRKTAITARVMQLVHELCMKGIHATKRDVFYTDVKLFKTQNESDDVLNDVACMIGSTRNSLNVVASDKGVVIGRVRFREAGNLIDCSQMGIGGKAIPAHADCITDIEGDAEFVLLVEKDAAFMRLAEDRFYNTYPCMIITAKGQPDVGTRLFLRKCVDQLQIPVLALMDADPYGLKILSVYTSGSKNMAYDSLNLTTPNIRWLGVRPSDLDRYDIPEQCRLDMTPSDLATGKQMLKEDFVTQNPDWEAELRTMVRFGHLPPACTTHCEYSDT